MDNRIDDLYKTFLPLIDPYKPIAIVCIGTDLVGGDCLGPVVGQLLVEDDVPAYVYGTLTNPVSALNVECVNRFVRLRHLNHTVIAVDAAVGKDVGTISVRKGAITPGAANGKRLSAIGDISVTAVTSSSTPDENDFALVRLGFIYSLAKKISALIKQCLCTSFYYNPEVYAIDNILAKPNLI